MRVRKDNCVIIPFSKYWRQVPHIFSSVTFKFSRHNRIFICRWIFGTVNFVLFSNSRFKSLLNVCQKYKWLRHKWNTYRQCKLVEDGKYQQSKFNHFVSGNTNNETNFFWLAAGSFKDLKIRNTEYGIRIQLHTSCSNSCESLVLGCKVKSYRIADLAIL